MNTNAFIAQNADVCLLVPALPGYSIGYSLSTYVAMCQAQGQVFLTILEYKYFGIFLSTNTSTPGRNQKVI